ncbi:hypothetical protein CEXT_356391 [Caerostris extrusa]|uniref:Uncharacterized protein n=1 Tax=Caerostris extrusa TaxID=172846 RepID=A0AAV4RS72_CAEEX|nr:hypothetical protein CEXT_356391 [Caerostris extrusa]
MKFTIEFVYISLIVLHKSARHLYLTSLATKTADISQIQSYPRAHNFISFLTPRMKFGEEYSLLRIHLKNFAACEFIKKILHTEKEATGSESFIGFSAEIFLITNHEIDLAYFKTDFFRCHFE